MKFKKGPKANAVGWTHASVSARRSPVESNGVAKNEVLIALEASDSVETSIMASEEDDGDDDDDVLEDR
jgi:hypothetical protein